MYIYYHTCFEGKEQQINFQLIKLDYLFGIFLEKCVKRLVLSALQNIKYNRAMFK